jgi:membrane fusion protein, multidrug efflux system
MRKLVVSVAVGVVAAMGIVALTVPQIRGVLWPQVKAADAPPAPAPGVPVTAGVVEAKDMPVFLNGIGTVQAFNMVTIKSRVDGQLVKVNFKEGQEVTAGDPLIEIDPRPF